MIAKLSAGDVVPAADYNQIIDNAGIILNKTTGEAINGSTTPIPVCVKPSDGLIYKADANTSTLVDFIGFIYTNASITTQPPIISSGILGGFSSLTIGAQYYVQDTVGTIGTTPSATCVIPVGIAISATEILVQKGKKIATTTGSITPSHTGSDSYTDTSVVIGFKPSRIEVSFHMHGTSGGGTVMYADGDGVWLPDSTNFAGGLCSSTQASGATFMAINSLVGAADAFYNGNASGAYSKSRLALVSFDTNGFTYRVTEDVVSPNGNNITADVTFRAYE